MDQSWYIINDIDQLDTPALVIYPERVHHNIELLKNSIDDVSRLRVHAKTHKSADATKLLLAAGIHKFKCATIAESEMLAASGAPDVLLAYQPTGPKIIRFIQLIKQFPATVFACLVDNEHSAKDLSQAAIKAGVEICVYIDINTGMNRTGIMQKPAMFLHFFTGVQLPNLKLMGLHAYDGHIHDSDYNTRVEQCNAAFAKVEELSKNITDHGLPKPIIVAGGSPTFPIHANRGEVECSPGTFIYWDWGYGQHFQEQAFLPAALVVTRVISIPSAGRLCLDAGHKSIASESSIDKRIHFLNAPQLKVVGHSEEHLMAEGAGAERFKVGDVLYGVPYHICPTVALYDSAVTVEKYRITGEWETTARNRKITI